MSLGNQIKSLREERKMLQKELAVMLKVTCGTISNYENDVHFPDEDSLRRIADIFDVSVDFLLGRTKLRYRLDVLNNPLEEDYTLSMLVDKIVSLDVQQQLEVRQYAEYLESIQKKRLSKKQ